MKSQNILIYFIVIEGRNAVQNAITNDHIMAVQINMTAIVQCFFLNLDNKYSYPFVIANAKGIIAG